MKLSHPALPLLLVALATLTIACSDESDARLPIVNPLDSGADFVAIPRHLGAAAAARRDAVRTARALPPAGAGEVFYLAVKKSQLGNRWFLSAYLEQYFPGAVASGAARSLGTRVVSFRVQNDKLFVFDAADGRASSDVFDPEVLVEAYPIVDDDDFHGLPHSGDYVLFDPAAGLNRFGVVGDWYAQVGWSGATHFQVDLSFLQHFRSLADGVLFEQVFTGYADTVQNTGPLETNAFQGSGTLSIALRRYSESPGFTRFPAPTPAYYFLGDPLLDHNSNDTHRLAAHWNIHPGMRPIKWLISPHVGAYVAAHPELQGADIVGSLKRGIESWNAAFGFTVLQAEVASPDVVFGDDDRNYVIFDPGPGGGFAYANWRTNPNTGEIRGADVYFGAEWLSVTGFSDDPPPAAAALPSLVWAGAAGTPLCVRRAGEGRGPGGRGDDDDQLTVKQKLEAYIEQMIVHEVGHTLGLRHNFKGTLTPPTGSVMDYMFQEERIAVHTPGPFDVQAIRWLYGLAPDKPTLPFCNDDDVSTDPDCRKFDRGADPMNGFWKTQYARMQGWMFNLTFLNDDWFDWSTDGLLGYARAGSGDVPKAAYAIVTAGARPPITAAQAADPKYALAADYISFTTLRLLYGRYVSHYASITKEPSNPALLADLLADERGILLNVDGVRSFPARRLCVDLLKQAQTIEAYAVLVEARDALAAQLAASDGTLTGAARLQAEDLLARVHEATTPYFD
jgi:hypothetical protein